MPGFLKHNADDSTVSPVFTCRLGEHLGGRAQVTIDGAGEHGPTNDFMAKAWAFFSTKSLADGRQALPSRAAGGNPAPKLPFLPRRA